MSAMVAITVLVLLDVPVVAPVTCSSVLLWWMLRKTKPPGQGYTVEPEVMTAESLAMLAVTALTVLVLLEESGALLVLLPVAAPATVVLLLVLLWWMLRRRRKTKPPGQG